MAADRLAEPAVAVLIAAPRRGRAGRPACADPGLGDDAATVDLAAEPVHLAEAQQSAGREQHVVAAEVDALRITRPGRDRDAQRLAQPLAGEVVGAAARGAGQDGGHQVRAAGGIDHPAAGVVVERTGQGVAHPVSAGHPGAVVLARGAAEAGLHRQQIADGDALQARIAIGRQVGAQDRGDGLIRPLQHPAFNGDAGQGGEDRLGGRLDVDRLIERRAAQAFGHERFAVAGDDQRMQAGDGAGLGDHLLHGRRVEAARRRGSLGGGLGVARRRRTGGETDEQASEGEPRQHGPVSLPSVAAGRGRPRLHGVRRPCRP